MQYGICSGIEIADTAAKIGYDYIEMTVGDLLKPLEPDSAFLTKLEQVKAAALTVPVLNCFIPGDLKITGPDVNFEKLTDYVSIVCERAKIANVEIIVFGSGGARRIPPDYETDKAYEQLLTFCQMLGPIAQKNGVIIAIEPLNTSECNVLLTVAEATALIREVTHPAIRLLVDSYHWAKDHDREEDIVAAGALIIHTHIATVTNRMVPGTEDCDFIPFFRALKQIGYNSRLSIEGQIANPESDLTLALALMKKLFN